MTNREFFDRKGPFLLKEVVGTCIDDGFSLPNKKAENYVIQDMAPLAVATSHDIGFLDNRKYLEDLKVTKAGAVFVTKAMSVHVPSGTIPLITKTPYMAYAKVSDCFYPRLQAVCGIHPKAYIHSEAKVDATVEVMAGAFIGKGAVVEKGCIIGPNAVIDKYVHVGAFTHVGAGVYIGFSIIGKFCFIHPGVCIGNRGFGFAMSPQGHKEIAQLGRVIIGDDVEVGANSTIDRGQGPDTIIGTGCKIDNLVQIGHNVHIGEGCVIVAQAGIAGSTHLETGVIVAAQAGVAGHLTIGTGAQIGAKTGVMRDVQAGEKVFGIPAQPLKQFFRQYTLVQRLGKKRPKEG